MRDSAGRLPARFMSLATKGGRRIALLARLAWYGLLAPFGHEDYVPFIVLTRSRTGSNLLVSFLNGHPDIFCEGEIFARMAGRDPGRRGLRRTRHGWWRAGRPAAGAGGRCSR